jgi:hypothetical protein
MLVGDNLTNAEGGNAEHEFHVCTSILFPLPQNLFDLWQEYIEGIGGKKPARHFSFSERGCVKHPFHIRKMLWDMISGLTRQGYTANSAIDLIYNVYGQKTSSGYIRREHTAGLRVV